MAIALDATSSGGPFTSGATHTTTHVCTGSNLILIAGVYHGGTINTATYNGTNMTKLNTYGANGLQFDIWYLINPTTGSHTLSFTDSSTVYGIVAGSYTGAKQSGQFDSSNNAQAVNNTSLSVSDTIVQTNCWQVGVILAWGFAGTITTSSNITDRVTVTDSTNTTVLMLSDSNAVTGIGSHTVNWNQSQGNGSGAVLIGLLATTSATPTTYTLSCTKGQYNLTGEAITAVRSTHMTIPIGSYALTGEPSTFVRAWHFILTTGQYALSGINAALTWAGLPLWIPVNKGSSSWNPTNKSQ